MRILLTANASYLPPRGGATRSNLLWMEQLAARGNACRIVAAALPREASRDKQLTEEGVSHESLAARGIQIVEVAEKARLSGELRRQANDFQPDWILVSSEDLGHALLREAHHSAAGRVVYLAHTPQFFPFGPASWNPDPAAAELVRRAAAIVAIGGHMAEYVREHSGREATVIHPPIYGNGPFPNLASFDGGLVTMVNPCAVKGIAIFLELARRFPEQEFGVLPGWGTSAADREALGRQANIQILPNCRHIDEFLARTRVLLMPSLWYEGFGLTVMEAMLHGIPVISSDAGGLVEAKMGTPYTVHAPAIERYLPEFDEHSLPKPVIGPIAMEPWEAALRELLTDRAKYEQVSAVSREAALRLVAAINAGCMAQFLTSLKPSDTERQTPSLANLSPEKRTLLLRLARSRKV